MLEKIEKFQILLLALVLGICGIIATVIFTNTMSKDVITVTGSYSQTVTSDKGTYDFDVIARDKSRAAAYATLKKQKPIIIKYFSIAASDRVANYKWRGSHVIKRLVL